MKCAEVHPNLAAFALGGLEAEEAAEIRRHLASCPGCQSDLEELLKVNSVPSRRRPHPQLHPPT
jgi:anti-sigma factor RsiW